VHGASVAGRVYPFTAPDTNVRSVKFYLDDSLVRIEETAPYDLMGGSTTFANYWDTTTVADGPHTILARIRLTNGTVVDVTSTFDVVNGQ
jgi:hypothetical protein